MKKYLLIMLLVAAGLSFHAPSAKADLADGALFLGFYDSTSGSDYLIYIGNYSNYTTAGGKYTGGPITLNTASGIAIGTASQISADLTTVFGAGWATDPTLKFGVVGSLDYLGANTIFVTDPHATSTTSAWSVFTAETQQNPATDIDGLSSYWVSSGTAGTAAQGKIQNKSLTGSYFSYSPGGTVSNGASFEYYANGGIDKAIALSNTLVELVATDASSAGTAVQPDGSKNALGTFTVSSNGTITYAAIPEPSSCAFVILGAVVFVMARRKNKAHAEAV